ncbi:MAG: methyltransferase domain-containing protein [Elusimicrobia bacterium]|nr:methyltransferase domain-containing protein [Elusimicrobiota bacterium]MBU2614480.1 methyltransferase domain-containing protein [Elusimicrobiota bacterium]
MEYTKCNICDSGESVVLIDGDYKYVRCKQCGLVYKNPRVPEEEWISSLKESARENAGEIFLEAEKELFADIISKIDKKRAPAAVNIKLLDIGCGYGAFLALARLRKGWDVAGTEMGIQAANFVRNVYGVNVYQKNIQDMNIRDKEYDIVTLFGVLDFFYDPVNELVEIKRIIKADGLLVMRLNNGLWHLNLTRFAWPLVFLKLFPAVLHLYVFTPKSVKKMLEKAGFESIEIYNSKFTKGDIYGTGGPLGRPFVSTAKELMYLLSQFIYYISLKNIVIAPTMVVIARRRV